MGPSPLSGLMGGLGTRSPHGDGSVLWEHVMPRLGRSRLMFLLTLLTKPSPRADAGVGYRNILYPFVGGGKESYRIVVDLGG